MKLVVRHPQCTTKQIAETYDYIKVVQRSYSRRKECLQILQEALRHRHEELVQLRISNYDDEGNSKDRYYYRACVGMYCNIAGSVVELVQVPRSNYDASNSKDRDYCRETFGIYCNYAEGYETDVWC